MSITIIVVAFLINSFCMIVKFLFPLVLVIWALAYIIPKISKKAKENVEHYQNPSSATSNTSPSDKEAEPSTFACLIGVVFFILFSFFVIAVTVGIWEYHSNYKEELKDLAKKKFNFKKWHMDENRYQMYEDLKKNYLNPGLSMDKVLGLLGKPECLRSYNNYSYQGRCLQYYLGMPGYIHTGYYLVVCPDKNNNAVEKVFYLSSRRVSKILDGGKKIPLSGGK